MKSGNVMLAVLAGLAAGAAIGVLMAPDKGSKTIKKLNNSKDEMLDGLKDKFNGFMDDFSKKLEAVKEEVLS